MNRREMLKQTGVMGTGLVLGGVMGACATTPGMSQGPNQDVAILNFALNLGGFLSGRGRPYQRNSEHWR